MQERVLLRVLKSFKRSGLLEEHDVENMKTWNGGGGFSVNGTARIHGNDREDWKDCYDIVPVHPSHWSEDLSYCQRSQIDHSMGLFCTTLSNDELD